MPIMLVPGKIGKEIFTTVASYNPNFKWKPWPAPTWWRIEISDVNFIVKK